METAWLRGLCGQSTAYCLTYEKEGGAVLGMTVISVAVCNWIGESTDRSLSELSLGAVRSMALLEPWHGSSFSQPPNYHTSHTVSLEIDNVTICTIELYMTGHCGQHLQVRKSYPTKGSW